MINFANEYLNTKAKKVAAENGYAADKFETLVDNLGIVWVISYRNNQKTRIGFTESESGEIIVTKKCKASNNNNWKKDKHPITAYVDDQLYGQIVRKATSLGITVSEYIRQSIKQSL